MIHTIFFDLDNTLYSRKSGIWEAIGSRINLFMLEVMHIPEQEVRPLRTRFKNEFGTTLGGLQSLFDVNEREYLDYVHDVNLAAMLTDDGRLGEMLSKIPQRKIIFTNSDSAHTKRVLDFFHIAHHFEMIIDLIAMRPYVKPQPEAYRIALDQACLESPDGCMFIDDLLENVAQAQIEGFKAIYVGDFSADYPYIKDIYGLPGILDA